MPDRPSLPPASVRFDASTGLPEPADARAASRGADPPADPAQQVDPATRLVLARLATGTSTLAGAPAAPRATPAGVGRTELLAFGAALVGATLIGVALPQAGPVQARSAAAPVAATTVAAVAAPVAPSTPVAAEQGDADPAAEASVSLDTPAAASDATALAATPAVEVATADDVAADPAPVQDAPAADDPAAGDPDSATDAPATPGRLSQVALVIVHGDQPVRWRSAAPSSPARARAALGTTFTAFAQLPSAPLATGLAAVAGQAPNAATTAPGTCDGIAVPVAPGTLDALGRADGVGCDYPAGTPSLPTAVTVDGRRWKAYAPLPAADAVPALCGTPVPAAGSPAEGLARTSPLRRLADLTSSGACEAVASPLSALRADLAAAEPPSWLVIEIGACGTDGCDPAEAAARDRDLDETLATLTAEGGLAKDGAAIVIGDGTGDPAGLAPADASSVVTAPGATGLPAPVATGALLVGPAVPKDAIDPLALDPVAIARAQADWLGLTPPGWAAAPETTALAVPGA